MSEETIFTEASRIADPALRAAYLDAACGGDAALRRRVEALLAAHEAGGSFLEPPVGVAGPHAGPASGPTVAATEFEGPAGAGPSSTLDGVATFTHSPAPHGNGHAGPRPLAEGPGSIIGPYTLVQVIGEGGMGTVFLAEQQKPVRRKVALKVIKAGMDTEQVIARFEAERQALALMDHPNIAKVHDAGTTDAGRPFFVMELVQGQPITRYCDEARLTPRERLELFIPVCQAVQHAHQKGIIHRDLKPTNVLVIEVDGKPVPKVIDFGIAKATDQRLSERSLFTQFGAVVGTPEYMSPEQAGLGSMDVDTRSDVYSLGVLLYELLTGSTPLDRARLREAGFDEILRRIREEEPPPPSSRLTTTRADLPSLSAVRHTEPARLAKLVRGELDWIVMKALEKDRSRRYETANGLARDLRRHLDGDPVEAGPPSRTYRLRKFARKHRAALATAAAFAMMLVAATVGLTIGAIQLARANEQIRQANTRLEQRRREAVANLEQAEKNFSLALDAVDRFYVKVSEDRLLNEPHMERLRRELLETAREFYQKFVDDRKDDPRVQAELGRAYQRLSLITSETGSQPEAIEQVERSLAIFAKLARDHPENAQYRSDLALSHYNLGKLLHAASRMAPAEEAYKRAAAIQEDLARDRPEVAMYQLYLIRSYFGLGWIYQVTGRTAPAGEAFKRAVAIQEDLVRNHPEIMPQFQTDDIAHTILGYYYHSTGQLAAAEEAYKRGVAFCERLIREHRENIEFRSGLAASLTDMGSLYCDLGQWAPAEEAFKRAVAIREDLARDHPEVIRFRRDLATSLFRLGQLYRLSGRLEQAEDGLKRAVAHQEQLAREHPEVTRFRRELGFSIHSLGWIYRVTGRLILAEEALKQAKAINERLASEHPGNTEFQSGLAWTYRSLGELHRDAGRPGQAEDAFKRAMAIHERLARDHPDIAEYQLGLDMSHHDLALCYRATGQSAAAEEVYKRVIAIREEQARDHPERVEFGVRLGGSYCELGRLARDRGQPQAACGWYGRAVLALQEVLNHEPQHVVAQQRLRDAFYDLACVEALAATAARDDSTSEPAERTARAEQLASRALEHLERAHAAGFFRDPANLAHVHKNPDLDALRSRQDFRVWQAALLNEGFPSDPFAR